MKKLKKCNEAAYLINKAKDILAEAVEKFENNGMHKEAEQLEKKILQIEKWTWTHN